MSLKKKKKKKKKNFQNEAFGMGVEPHHLQRRRSAEPTWRSELPDFLGER